MKRTFMTVAAVAAAGIIGLTVGEASAQDAKAIYAKECAKCHGDSGAGDTRMGKSLKVSDWTTGAGLEGMDDAKIAESIKKGGPAVGKSKAMPAYAKLSDAEVKALVAHIKALKK